MAKPNFTLHRERLLALRARLQGDVTQMADNALKESKTNSMPTDMAEVGTGNFDQEFTLSLLGSGRTALAQIEAAIERIEDGSYGRCEECGEQISKTRLDAIPYAAQCVRCASKEEGDFQPRILAKVEPSCLGCDERASKRKGVRCAPRGRVGSPALKISAGIVLLQFLQHERCQDGCAVWSNGLMPKGTVEP